MNDERRLFLKDFTQICAEHSDTIKEFTVLTDKNCTTLYELGLITEDIRRIVQSTDAEESEEMFGERMDVLLDFWIASEGNGKENFEERVNFWFLHTDQWHIWQTIQHYMDIRQECRYAIKQQNERKEEELMGSIIDR